MQSGYRKYLPAGWSCFLALLILAPVLRSGFVLHLDMVFVPQQVLLPWNLGVGAGLPRSVPQDAIVALMSGPVPGQWLQKIVLLAALALAGVGAARLAGGGLLRRLAAVSLYVWSAYLASRLLMGHWGLLWSYALLPWVVLAAADARSKGRWPPLAVLCGLGALVPTGGVMLAAAGVPLAVAPGSRLPMRSRMWLASAVVLFNAPWWFPAARSGVAEVSDPLGLVVFGARSDGPWPLPISLLSGGGVWNTQAHLTSRENLLALLVTVLIAVLAVIGWSRWRRERPAEAVWIGLLALLGWLWAWLTGIAGQTDWTQALVSQVPGGGLLRDGQKWVVFWVLLVAIAAPRGLEVLIRRFEEALRLFLAGTLVVLPLLIMPDLGWGAAGRLRTTEYPRDWDTLRSALAADPRGGDVLSLPWWTAFRSYPWNRQQPVLDPLPRYLTRTVVWNDSLPVDRSGEVLRIAGDDPRAQAVTAAIEQRRPLGPVLGELGIRWIVTATDQPSPGPTPNLVGTVRTWSEAGLELREVVGAVVVRQPRDVFVVAVDVVALLVLVGLSGAALRAHRLRLSA